MPIFNMSANAPSKPSMSTSTSSPDNFSCPVTLSLRGCESRRDESDNDADDERDDSPDNDSDDEGPYTESARSDPSDYHNESDADSERDGTLGNGGYEPSDSD